VIVDCGNGVIDQDQGEVCDDGNQVSGDGCSADCRSDERCGNGYVDFGVGERCDATNLAGESCESLGYTGGGTLVCNEFCRFDEGDCHSICGNGQREPDETCDGADLGEETCAGLGLGGGVLGCRPDCRHYDTSDCDIQAECGNETIEHPEACDGNNVGGRTCASEGFYTGSLSCAADCLSIDESGCAGYCGDGQKNGPEACDGVDLEVGGSCENCGHQERTCDNTCQWGSWTCVDQGVCSPGQVDTGGSCTNCGHDERTCSGTCQWGSWTCVDQGVCSLARWTLSHAEIAALRQEHAAAVVPGDRGAAAQNVQGAAAARRACPEGPLRRAGRAERPARRAGRGRPAREGIASTSAQLALLLVAELFFTPEASVMLQQHLIKVQILGGDVVVLLLQARMERQ
jgi:cysteine-rich repeat protein